MSYSLHSITGMEFKMPNNVSNILLKIINEIFKIKI